MPQQVVRLGALFVVGIVAFVVVRARLVPDTFGDLGHYRAAAIDTIVAHPMKYAGSDACGMCHSPVLQVKSAGHHSGVACEVCHGAALAHVESPGTVKPGAPRDRGLCPLCHGYNASRPTGFPQIDPMSHNGGIPCVTCHKPHAPEPPVPPNECRACHGQIASQKAVSHHAPLPCETCHQAQPEHKITPRAVRPTKPTGREFCGACHAMDAGTPANIPKIDLRSHEPDHLCWQCHYPHYPETR
jgi:hypothetical protein